MKRQEWAKKRRGHEKAGEGKEEKGLEGRRGSEKRGGNEKTGDGQRK